jgi:hypothetical protein
VSPSRKPSRKQGSAAPDQRRSIIELRIVLLEIEPPIWRTVRVPAASTLADLHDVIQAAMGWEDAHLHEFLVKGVRYSTPPRGGFDFGWEDEPEDERRARLSDLVRRKGQRLTYEYDMGDMWQHDARVEQLLEPEEGVRYPVCVAGERACPPEDIGGAWGYAGMIEALRDPRHPDHEDLMEWVGDFDPEAFDLEEANRRLRSLR